MAKLQTLYMHDNILTIFEPDFSSSVATPPLVDLLIHNNKLKQLNQEVFNDMTFLRYLNAGDNRLESFPDFSLMTHTNNLGYLDLRNNAISSMPEESIENLNSLVSLYISGN
ncbi:hypothetical protein CAPTEDRAFT_133775, partial [Capitella teleta]